jgi:hypothetical protein
MFLGCWHHSFHKICCHLPLSVAPLRSLVACNMLPSLLLLHRLHRPMQRIGFSLHHWHQQDGAIRTLCVRTASWRSDVHYPVVVEGPVHDMFQFSCYEKPCVWRRRLKALSHSCSIKKLIELGGEERIRVSYSAKNWARRPKFCQAGNYAGNSTHT